MFSLLHPFFFLWQHHPKTLFSSCLSLTFSLLSHKHRKNAAQINTTQFCRTHLQQKEDSRSCCSAWTAKMKPIYNKVWNPSATKISIKESFWRGETLRRGYSALRMIWGVGLSPFFSSWVSPSSKPRHARKRRWEWWWWCQTSSWLSNETKDHFQRWRRKGMVVCDAQRKYL